jgi:hypothetical protein
MIPLVQTVFPEGRSPYTPRLNVHLDNWRVHFSKVTEEFFSENAIVHVPHSPDSHDLAPYDFWLFDRIKTEMAGCSFEDPEKLLTGIQQFLDELSEKERIAVFTEWIKRVRWVISHNGEYYGG